MNLTFHIFKKDLRYLRWFLVGWLGLTAFGWLILGAGMTSMARDTRFFQYLQYSWSLVLPLNFLLMGLIIARFVQEDSTVGTTSSWITRPISRIQLLKEKFLFLALVFILAPVVLDLACLRLFGFTFEEMGLALPQLLLWQLVLSLSLMAIASVSRDLARAALTGIMLAVSIYLVTTLLIFIQRTFFPKWHPVKPAELTSMVLVVLVFLFLAPLLLIIHQYLTRKVGRSIVVGSIFMVLAMASMNFWKWNIMGESETWASKDKIDPASIQLSIDYQKMLAAAEDLHQFNSEEKKPLHKIGGGLVIESVNTHIIFTVNRIRSKVQLADGKIIVSKTNSEYIDPYARNHPPDPSVIRAMESASGANQILYPDRMDSFQLLPLPVWIEIDETLFEQYGKKTAELTGELELDADEWRVAARLPINAGSNFHYGGSYQIDLLNIQKRANGCRLQLRLCRSFFLLQQWENQFSDTQIALFNRNSRELILGKSFTLGVLGNISSFRFLPRPLIFLRFHFDLWGIFYDFDWQKSPAPISRDSGNNWLADAEIVLLQRHRLGKIKKDFKVTDFVMNPDPSAGMARLN